MTTMRADVREHWHWVRPLVQKIRSRTAESWMVDDVFVKLNTDPNYALLVDPAAIGEEFAVVRVESDAITGERRLFVWLAYSEKGDAVTAHLPEFQDLARTVGAGSLIWGSHRPGYQRALRHLPGFEWNYEYRLKIYPQNGDA